MRRHYVDISKIQIFCHKQVFQVLTQKWVVRKLNRCFLMEGYHISFFFSSGKMSTEYTWGWTFCSLLVARYFLLVAFCSLLVTFCSFARCLLWNKVTLNRKKMVWLLRNSATDIFLANFWDFRNFFRMVVFKVFSTCETIFKIDIKSVTNIGYHYDVFITISGHVFIYFYVLEESEIVSWKSSMKEVFLNIPKNLQENICAGVSFTIKLQAEGL